VFFFISLNILLFCALAMAAMGLDIVTAITSVIATLNNIGPGLERVGAVQNFAFIPTAGKLLLSLCMVLGRLELITILVLFMPSFWKAR
ncbi:MAG TPA: potassium transporter, partial [Candidatus Latescibacteria bacterium]|nr:potassium transporter [Candidatus Latescibacterota bacterium]